MNRANVTVQEVFETLLPYEHDISPEWDAFVAEWLECTPL